MTIKFIHASDWQIGKVFHFVNNATTGLLRGSPSAVRIAAG